MVKAKHTSPFEARSNSRHWAFCRVANFGFAPLAARTTPAVGVPSPLKGRDREGLDELSVGMLPSRGAPLPPQPSPSEGEGAVSCFCVSGEKPPDRNAPPSRGALRETGNNRRHRKSCRVPNVGFAPLAGCLAYPWWPGLTTHDRNAVLIPWKRGDSGVCFPDPWKKNTPIIVGYHAGWSCDID